MSQRPDSRDGQRLRRPVVARDVDGVLNVERSKDLGSGWLAHPLEIPAADVPDLPFVAGHGRHVLSLPVVLNPGLHASWIRDLRERAEVVWVTTWEDTANVHLAPLVGIDPLPVGVSIKCDPPKYSVARDGDVAMWKAMALSRRFSCRPLVWIDDSNAGFAQSFPGRRRKTLVVTTDPRVGLTSEQMREVDDFVNAHPSRPSDPRIVPLEAAVPYAPSFVVADSLDGLLGPATGEVTLPNRLLWNHSRPFDLTDEKRLRSMLRIVLREARSQEDLARFVDRDSLVRLWPSLGLPARVRTAWESAHPELGGPHERR